MRGPQNSCRTLTQPKIKSPLGPKKSQKMTPKLSQNQISEVKKNRKWKLFNYISKDQHSCRTLLRTSNQPIRAKKRQKWPQIQDKIKCQNSGNHWKWKLFNYIENICCSATKEDLKLFSTITLILENPDFFLYSTLTYLNLNSISTKLRLDLIPTWRQPQPQINLSLNINLNSTLTST